MIIWTLAKERAPQKKYKIEKDKVCNNIKSGGERITIN